MPIVTTTENETDSRRCIVAGLDEAGFGPLLGPLVIGATAWEVPPGCGGDDLWDRLRGGVSRRPSRRLPRLAINDSKKIYSPRKGLLDLERGVLGTMAVQVQPGQQGQPGDDSADAVAVREPWAALTLGRFLDRLTVGWAGQVADHAWYQGCGDLALPVESEPADLATRTNGLRVAMQRSGVRFLGAGLELLLETRYNQLSDSIGNKSRLLFCTAARLIHRLFERFGGDRLTIMCDKQGGRDCYRPLLLEHWPDLKLEVLIESAERSGYRLAEPPAAGRIARAMELWFLPGADLKYLPAALASMYCKYTRELFMRVLNRFWQGHVGADLKPTAGYYTDGLRFIRDVSQAAGRLGLSTDRLVRNR